MGSSSTRERDLVSDDWLEPLSNAGAKLKDSEVVVDNGIITSHNPGDLKALREKALR